MLEYLTLIFGCQLAGELIVAATGLPVPGPVCGMAPFAAMGLNALATAILLPLLWHLFF